MTPAEGVEGEALTTLVVNRLRGSFPSQTTQAPGFGDRRKAMMEDIAILTGATPVMEDMGVQMESLATKELGTAKKVVITKDTTLIVEGAGKKAQIKARIEQIRAEIEASKSDYDGDEGTEPEQSPPLRDYGLRRSAGTGQFPSFIAPAPEQAWT